MKSMGLKFSPLIVGHLLGPLSMFRLLAGTFWTHSYSSPNSPDGDIIRLTYTLIKQSNPLLSIQQSTWSSAN